MFINMDSNRDYSGIIGDSGDQGTKALIKLLFCFGYLLSSNSIWENLHQPSD